MSPRAHVLSLLLVAVVLRSVLSNAGVRPELTDHEVASYRDRTISMFSTAFGAYRSHASDFDELQPISCTGRDTWGTCSLSLIDALDTMLLMGNFSEFGRVSDILIRTQDFDRDVNVSVFETNIRVVGGLLSAHLLSHLAPDPLPPDWPCSGPLLKLAEDVGRRLLPAFETQTGMPYGTVNLKYGVPDGETEITCCAGVGTFVIEFGTLSRLTGDPVFEAVALRAIESMHKTRSSLNLPGNHINITTGVWTAIESSIGAGVDSFFEYLVKGSMLLHNPRLMQLFYVYYDPINRFMSRDDWMFVVHKDSGLVTMPVFQSLESFWPGLLTLIGEIDRGRKTLYNYHQILRQFGFLPEMYDVSTSSAKRSGYPLRPEFVESLFYMYRATRDPYLRIMAAEVIEAIEHATKTECGYATVQDVNTHLLEDRMESFFLSETLKYLFLIFAPEDHFMLNSGSTGKIISVSGVECVISAGGYIFNTEAHPVDVSCTDCCVQVRQFLDRRERRQSEYSASGMPAYELPLPVHQSFDTGGRESLFCHSSSKDMFLHLILKRPRQPTNIPVTTSESFDFDFMTCPVQSLFSRFSLYGQVAQK